MLAQLSVLLCFNLSGSISSNKCRRTTIERIGEVVESAHLIENEVIVETLSDDPDFRWTIANPIQLGSLKHRRAGDPPRLGEHTRSILATLGYGEDQIEALLNQGIVKVS